MAVVVFSQAVPFAIAALRQALTTYLPLYRWHCGEDDDGGAQQTGSFARHGIIAGRATSSVVFTEYRATDGRFAGGPEGAWHLEIFAPTTEHEGVADRIVALICATVMDADRDAARCRLLPGSAWLSADAVDDVVRRVSDGKPMVEAIAAAARGGERAATLPGQDLAPHARSAVLGYDVLGAAAAQRSLAKLVTEKFGADFAKMCGHDTPPVYADEEIRRDRLQTMVLMLDAALAVDWAQIAEGVAAIDPDGGWRVAGQPDGAATIAGRGCRITLAHDARAVPAYLIETALSRSFWVSDGGDRARLRDHDAQLVATYDLDTAAADPADVRQTAKIVSLVLGLIAHTNPVAGLYAAGTESVRSGAQLAAQLGALAQDEVPVQLWIWTAHHALETDAVSLSTAGMLPFTGYEVEAWNAPGTAEFVNDKMSGVLRYLLTAGPVVAHGDTIGVAEGDRTTRCFFGESRAGRAQPVRAMLLEFAGPDGVTPRPDVPLDAVPSPGPPPGPARGEDRVAWLALSRAIAFPADEIVAQLAGAIPDARWTRDAGGAGLREPRTLTGDRHGSRIAVRIVAGDEPLRGGDGAGAPDYRLHVRVAIDTGGDAALATRFAAIVCGALAAGQDPAAHARLRAGAPWTPYETLLNLMTAAKFAPDIDALVAPVARAAAAPPVAPPIAPAMPLRRVGGFGRKGL